MGHLRDHYNQLTQKQLERELSLTQKQIDENDGRLSTDSSCVLDYNLDKIGIIKDILSNKFKKKKKKISCISRCVTSIKVYLAYLTNNRGGKRYDVSGRSYRFVHKKFGHKVMCEDYIKGNTWNV